MMTLMRILQSNNKNNKKHNMTKEELKVMIDNTINSNGKRSITGKSLNLALSQIVECIGEEFNNREVEVKRNDVNFFDYDGTLLYAYTWEDAQALTELPQLPVHDGLEVREWNYTLEDIKAQGGIFFIAVDGTYYTYDNIVTIDGVEYKKYASFDENGEQDEWYIIHKSSDVAEIGTICYWYYDDGEESYIDVDDDGNPYVEYITNTGNTIGKADVGACVYDGDEQITTQDVVIIPRSDGDSFRYPGNSLILSVVSFPNTVSQLGRDVIYWSTLTSELKIPSSVKYIASGYAAFADISVPSFWWNGFNHKYESFVTNNNLQRLEIPETFTRVSGIPADCGCSYVKIPKTILSIDYLCDFNFNSYIAVIDFTSALAVPSLYGYNIFSNRSHIIVVPDNLYEEWINASNWSAFIDFIYKESDCPFISNF